MQWSLVWLGLLDVCHSPKLLPPEPLWLHNPRTRRILCQSHLYPGYHQTGCSRDQHPKNKHLQTLGSQHWWLIHYPKEPNCAHHQSGPWLCSLVCSTGLGVLVQEGNFWDGFKLLEAHPEMPVEGLLVSEGSSFQDPRSFGQSFTRWSGLPHPKQFWFFFWYGSTVLANQVI